MRGVIFRKNFVSRKMKIHLKKPRVLILSCALDVPNKSKSDMDIITFDNLNLVNQRDTKYM
jgi:hypothetical protein